MTRVSASWRTGPRAALCVLAAAAVVSAVLAPHPGYTQDVELFGTWMRVAVDSGLARVSEKTWCDYPPGYLLVLETTGLLWRLLTLHALPADGSMALRLLVKAPPILAGLALGWAAYAIVRPRAGERAALAACAATALNPAMLVDGPLWGQCDGLVALLLVLAAWAVVQGWVTAGFVLAIACVLVKLQGVVVIPVLLVAAWRLHGGRGLRGAWIGSALAGFGLLVPSYLAGKGEEVVALALAAAHRYPFVSLNAHNPWWLAFGPPSRYWSDAHRIGNGILTLRAIGLAALAAGMVLICCRLWRQLRERSDATAALMEACALSFLAFYLLPTQMHERYVVPAIPFLAMACALRGRGWLRCAVASVAVALSLLTTLVATFPGSLGAIGKAFPPGRQDAMLLAIVLTLLLPWIFVPGAGRRLVLAFALTPVALAAGVWIVAHVPLHGAQRLSDWEPVEQEQGWGELHRNQSVTGGRLGVAGFIFRHGIGTHSTSRLTWDLGGNFRDFDTGFWIDDDENTSNAAQFRIIVDGEVRYDSGVVRGSAFPAHARVPVAGARQLTLEVLDGGDGIAHDHADWLEPILIR